MGGVNIYIYIHIYIYIYICIYIYDPRYTLAVAKVVTLLRQMQARRSGGRVLQEYRLPGFVFRVSGFIFREPLRFRRWRPRHPASTKASAALGFRVPGTGFRVSGFASSGDGSSCRMAGVTLHRSFGDTIPCRMTGVPLQRSRPPCVKSLRLSYMEEYPQTCRVSGCTPSSPAMAPASSAALSLADFAFRVSGRTPTAMPRS